MTLNVQANKLYIKERIKNRSDISKFFKYDFGVSKYYGAYFSLFALKNEFDYSRFAVSIKSSSCNAVKRNRAKRIMREIFRNNKKIIPKGFDYFIFMKKPSSVPYKEKEVDLMSLFERVIK